jgi:DNA polymerase-3 subunit gamma/tau
MEKKIHKVLALKYRPKNFKELIGQDVMVETINNSIKINKLPNAYLLTGIRGVGKTTTARLIAKAINCNKHFDHGENSSKEEFCNCEQISDSKHLDILEMDAASKTGIDDVRELIDASKYNPTTAKYKVIILDEVHMLSKQAFNGLLKTLEEPPPHLKFIFATTEIKKIPVTIISRCQRFDLHRVPIKDLIENLKKIIKSENVKKISDGALIIISKAAEGSVRDSLSLLDRVIISQNTETKEIDEEFIRRMLGLADRSQILNLLNFIFQGNQKQSLNTLKIMINQGLEPVTFLNELLEIIYFIQQKKNIGEFENDIFITDSEKNIITSFSKNLDTSTIMVFWQLILKVLEELFIVSNPILSLEMLIVRLVHLKDIPSYENIIDSLDTSKLSTSLENNNQENSNQENNNQENNIREEKKYFVNEDKEIATTSKDQIKNVVQVKPSLSTNIKQFNVQKITSIEDLISISSQKKEIQLKYDLENNVNLIKFSEGKIDISFNENLDKNFVRSLSEKLLVWTGNRWVITLSKAVGQKTFSETQILKKQELLNKEKNGEVYKKFKNVFSDIELLEVKKIIKL